MAVTIADLRTPIGVLEMKVLFPREEKETLTAMTTRHNSYLTAWLADAEAKVTAADPALEDADADTVRKRWPVYRALSQVYKRLITTPSSVEVEEEGSSAYLLTQIEWVKDEAEAALAEVEVILAPEETTTDEPVLPPSTVSHARFGW